MPALEHSIEGFCALIRHKCVADNDDFKKFEAEKCAKKRFNIVKNYKTPLDIRQYATRESKKDSKAALSHKKDGNTEFQMGKWKEAIEYYNKALLYISGGDGADLAMMYGNRSAAFFNLRGYQLTIDDIEIAEPNFPKENLHRIITRKGKALMNLDRYPEALNCLIKAQQLIERHQKLNDKQKSDLLYDILPVIKFLRRNSVESSRADEKEATKDSLPFLMPSVKVETNEIEGRHVICKTPIKAGSLILKEKPYAAVLEDNYFPTHCDYCMKRIGIAPMYCHACIDVRYCSIICKTNAATYHKYECGFLNTFQKFKHSMAFHLAYRIIASQSLKYFLNKKDKNNNNKNSEPNAFERILTLVTHEKLFHPNAMWEYTMVAMFLTHILKLTGYLNGCDNDEENLIGSLVLHNILVLHYNAHEVFELERYEDEPKGKIKTIGGAIFPVLAFFNHSCGPNTVRYYDGTTVHLVATKPIAVGEQIYENYGPIFTQEVKKDRQLHLQDKYKFTCNCRACKEDWPLLKEAPRMESIFIKCQDVPNCRGVLEVKPGTKTDIKCPKCGLDMFREDIFQEIQAADDLMKEGFSLLEKGQIQDAIEKYLEAVTTLDSVIDLPFSKYHTCMKNLRASYAEIGNRHIMESFKVIHTNLKYFGED